MIWFVGAIAGAVLVGIFLSLLDSSSKREQEWEDKMGD